MAIVLPKFSRRRSSAGFAAETQPALNVRLCREDGAYESGGLLAAQWRISRIAPESLQSLEVSVMWHTEGKGDEDLHVHHFQRLGEMQLRAMRPGDEQSLRCQLPPTPLSYQGRLITIRWCIRLRLFMTDGREIVTEQPFHLVATGSRPAAPVRPKTSARQRLLARPSTDAEPPAAADQEAMRAVRPIAEASQP